MDDKTASEEFIRRESEAHLESPQVEPECNKLDSTEYDAVHPRFRESKKPEVIEEFQITHDFYCEQCKLFFAPDIIGLKTHFKEDMVQHQPVDKCFYCEGPVYAYSFNNERQIYHNCENAKS